MRVPDSDYEIAVARASLSAWARQPNVVGIGLTVRGGSDRDPYEAVLQVYIDHLPSGRRWPPGIPQRWETRRCAALPIEVTEIGPLRLESRIHSSGTGPCGQPDRSNAIRCGVAHEHGESGTAGCLVRKLGNQEDLFLLGAGHVLRNHGIGRRGDAIVRVDSREPIAELADWTPYSFSARGFHNTVDAAIAKIPPENRDAALALTPGFSGLLNSRLHVGMQVQKTGFGTGHTWGEVKDLYFRVQAHARRTNGVWGRLGLRNQVLCTRYSGQGDSGAAVLNAAGEFVGLHFAGTASVSIFHPIGQVFELLGLEVCTLP
jgi:hypothetical protein